MPSPFLLVDWDLAAATGARLVPPGPQIGYAEAEAVVADLRAAADEADEHVRDATHLSGDVAAAQTVVVDRPDWIRGNLAGFRTIVDPLAERLMSGRPAPSPAVTLVGSRVTAVQLGALLAYLGTRVLGQYEIFRPPGEGERGRLSLVAPNIVATERRLQLDPHDFRRWVALHEVTHRTQFTAVPWLRDHITDLLSRFVSASELDPAAVLRRVREAIGAASDAARARAPASPIELVVSPEQRQILNEVTGLMSLVEGHAEFVMDEVAGRLLPSAAELRERFDARRAGGSPLERFFRRLIGLELKMRQYAEGAAFVHAVVDRVGVDGFNRVWAGPESLPSADEIRDPAAWLARDGGPAAASA